MDNPTHIIPAPQGTLAKPSMPSSKPNFANKPFCLSRFLAGKRVHIGDTKRVINE